MTRRGFVPPKREGGFTLIELTVVLAVIVIATGILVVRVSLGTSRQDLHASARSLGNAIRTWREKARADEETYRFLFGERSWSVVAGKAELLKTGRLGAGEEFERGTPAAVTFNPRGVLPETRLTIRNARGERVSLVVRAVLNEVEYADEK